MTSFKLLFAADALDDLTILYEYVASESSPERGAEVLEQIQEACAKLAHFPRRGRVPWEFEREGATDGREIVVDKFRVFYLVDGESVIVTAIVDGRRNLSEFLRQRFRRRPNPSG